jgi:hypothetical protein
MCLKDSGDGVASEVYSGWQGMSNKAQPGHAYVTATLKTIAKVKEPVHADRRWSIRALVVQFDMSIGTMHIIM